MPRLYSIFSSFLHTSIEIMLCLIQIPSGFFEILVSKKIHSSSKKIIILLHGWGTRNVIYLPLKWQLQKMGYRVITPDFGWHIIDINKTVVHLKEFIHSNHLENITFVGHSEGGIIALAYAKENPSTVKKIITMGSPFHGSPHAKLASFFSQAAEQLKPNSLFLKKLVSSLDKDFWASKISCVYTSYDEVVPAHSASLPFVTQVIDIKKIGHFSFLYSPVMKKVFLRILI